MKPASDPDFAIAPAARRGRWRLWLGTGVSLLMLALMLREVDWRQLVAALLSLPPVYPVAAVGCLSLAYAVRIVRWQRMLRLAGAPISVRGCARPLLVGFALNNLLPLRAGDVARVFAFRDAIGLPASRILASLLIERLLDLLTLLALLALAALALPRAGAAGWVVEILFAAALLLLLLVVAVFAVMLSGRSRVSAWLGRLGTRLPGRFSNVAAGGLEQLRTALALISHPGALAGATGLSLLAWLLESGVFLLTALALAQPAQGAWFAMAAGNLGTLLPGAPGHLGTFDYFAMQGLMAFGADATPAAAFALIAHFLIWLPVTLAGLALMNFPHRHAR